LESQKTGSDKSSGNFERKSDAVDRARELAKNQELGQVKIHKQDGKFKLSILMEKILKNIKVKF